MTRCLVGEHGLGAAVECGDGERLQYRYVPETAEGQRRVGPTDTDEQIAGYNLGHRTAKRAAGGQFSQPLSEDWSIHRVRQTTRVELPNAGSGAFSQLQRDGKQQSVSSKRQNIIKSIINMSIATAIVHDRRLILKWWWMTDAVQVFKMLVKNKYHLI